MADISASGAGLLSSDRAVRTSELKRLERTIIPQLEERTALELLQQGLPGTDGEEAIGNILLTIIGDRDAPEICREKAAIVLRGCLQKSFGSRSAASGAGPLDGTKQRPYPSEYLGQFYVDFCSTFQTRISPPPSCSGSVEPSEEIRLVLVKIASDLLTYMDNLGICAATDQKQSLVDATSMICHAVAKKGMSDPYPDLKRECCAVLGKLAITFPNVVRMHAEALLLPIMGGSTAHNIAVGASSSATTASSSNASLVRHRHAKTRCLAIETSAAILSCCPVGDEASAAGGSRGGTLQDILQSHVLGCWEDAPLLDRSAPVRIALVKAVGSVSRLMVADFAVSADLPATFERHLLHPAPRLLVLLLMGMSDDSIGVGGAASDAFSMLDRECVAIGAAVRVEERKTELSLVAIQADNVLTILLYDVSHTWANERKTKALNALEVFIKLMNPSTAASPKTSAASRETAQQASVSCLESNMSQVVATLCSCFREDEDAILKATSSCACVLGNDSSLLGHALAVLLPSLSGPVEGNCASALIESNSAAKSQTGGLLLSEPQHFASALTLLGCLLRGASRRLDDTPEPGSGCLSFARAHEISSALNNDSVLDAASSTQAAAWALLDACQALCLCMPVASFGNGVIAASNSKDTNDLKSAIAVDTLTCAMHLLGCPGVFGLRNQTLELLDEITEWHIGIEGRAEMMRLYFRDILKCLLLDSSNAVGESIQFCAWKAGDRRLLAFEALLRNSGGRAVATNFELVAPVLESHLANTNERSASGEPQDVDYTVKLSIMALLESTVSDPSFPKELVQPFTAKLLNSVIMPNLVWTVGGMAAALRKVSAATLFSLLRSGSATAESLFVSAPMLLPVLKSNLTDDDATTRELICSSLGIIFELIPGALGEDAAQQLYLDLVTCLDDSSDSVRFATCNALKPFLKAAHPSHFQGAAINDMVDQLLIHMDDSNRDFQQAVAEVLIVALGVDQKVVVEKTLAVRSSHRSSEFCSLLLRKAEERAAAGKIMSSSYN